MVQWIGPPGYAWQCRGHRFNPWSEKIPHAWEQLSPSTTTTKTALVRQLLKPVNLEPVLHNKRGHCNEKPANHSEEQTPLAATRESPNTATKTQHRPKKKKKEFKKNW